MLDLHTRIHGGNKYLCDFCGYSTYAKSILSRHKASHAETPHFKCEYLSCQYAGKAKEYLKLHVEKVHGVGVKRFSCDLCDYSSNRNAHLARHKETHAIEFTYKCHFPSCSYKGKTSHTLAAHLKTHSTDAIPCSYPACSFVGKSKTRVAVHLRRTHGEKKFQCELCLYKTSQSWDLRRHVTNVHELSRNDEKTFVCDVAKCNYRGQTPSRLRRHVNRQHKAFNPRKINASRATIADN